MTQHRTPAPKSPEEPARSHFIARNTGGASLLEMSVVIGLVSVMSIGVVSSLGERNEETLCMAKDGLHYGMTGEEGECLSAVEMGAVVEPKPGIEDGEFVDLLLAEGHVDPVEVFLSARNISAPANFRVNPAAGPFEACYVTKAQETPVCHSSNVTLPADATHYGYRATPVSEVRDPFTYNLDLTLDQGGDIKAWSILAERPQTENTFSTTTVFTDQVFAAGSTGLETVMQPLAGEFADDVLKMQIVSARDEDYAVCYQEVEGGIEVCSSFSDQGYLTHSVPADAYAIGYAFYLPTEARDAFDQNIDIRLMSSYNTADRTTWAINNHRTPAENTFSTSMTFSDQVYAAGTTGPQYHLEPLVGEFADDYLRLTKSPLQGGLNFAPCYQTVEGGTINCGAFNDSVGSIEFSSTVYAVGYAATLPAETRADYNAGVKITLASKYDASVNSEWTLNNTRTPEPNTFSTSTTFSDQVYAAGTTGPQYHLEPLVGEFADDILRLTKSPLQGGLNFAPCYQTVEGGTINCGAFNDRIGSIEFSSTVYAVGYAATLPAETRDDYNAGVKITLASKYDASVNTEWTLSNTRTPEPNTFSTSTTFSDQVYAAGTTGPQYHMEPLVGEFADDILRLAKSPLQGGYNFAPCYQTVEGGTINCGAFNDRIGYIEFSSTVYAVGYAATLPNETRDDYNAGVKITLSSKYDTSVNSEWTLSNTRTPEPNTFSTSTAFSDQAYAAGTSGPQYHMEPLVGDFADDTLKLTTTPHSTGSTGYLSMAPCWQAVEGGSRSCGSASDRIRSMYIPSTAYAVGYMIVVAPETRDDFTARMTYTLASKYDTSVNEAWTLNHTRTPEPNTFSNSTTFSDQAYAAGTSGPQYHMEPLVGDFADDTLKLTTVPQSTGSTGYLYFAPCYQATEGGSRTCQSVSDRTRYMYIPSTAYAVGYQITVAPETRDDFTARVRLELASKYDPSVKEEWTLNHTRTPEPNTFSTSTAFSDQVYAAGTSGPQYHLEPLVGDFADDTLRLTTNPLSASSTSYLYFAPCYQRNEGGSLTCQSTNDRSRFIDFPSNAYAVGYVVILPNETSNEYNTNMRLTLASEYDSNVNKEWTLNHYRTPQ
jgi:hypothetical protein